MRPRRDPRTERLGHLMPTGSARPRFDWTAASGSRRPRRDPRLEAVLEPGPSGRLRLDRLAASAPGAANQAEAPPRARPPKAEPLRVDDAALRILVVADPGDGDLSAHDRQCLAAARRWVGPSGGVVLAVDRPIQGAGALGADRVLLLPVHDHPASRFEAVLHAVETLRLPHVLLPESEAGGDLARRLAARTGRRFFAGAEGVGPDGTLVRAVVGRGIDQLSREAEIATLRAGMVAPKAEPAREGRPVELAFAPMAERRSRRLPALRGAQPLAEADFVASAGNGIADLALFRRLAEALGATAGASRILCDSGLMPRSAQVGASGTVLAADCYLALGIAGAPQHLQGIAGCQHVIAVNTDLHAAMVERAGLAIVADAGPVMQAMLELLERGE